MSPREEAQNKLILFLTDNAKTFNAPYGVIDGLQEIAPGKGKVRTVTFGMARWLDCTVYIFNPKRITTKAAGPQSRGLDGEAFKSVDELIEVLKKKIG